MIVITKIYTETPYTIQMVKSFEKQGYEVAVLKGPHKGNGELLRELFECYKRAATGHKTFCYSDGADTYCQKTFDAPKDKIIYSTEKALFPPLEGLQYPAKPKVKSKWKHLNGGGVCGSLEVMIEFMEKYGLTKLTNEATAQLELHYAYFETLKDGFPFELDFNCKIFQCIAHMEEGDFEFKDGLVHNRITKTTPAIIHANGITPTPEDWGFKIW